MSAIKYCLDNRTEYINYIQAGYSSGIGTEITWMNGIGLDTSTESKAEILDCGMYHVEHRDKRVVRLEIGYIDEDLPQFRGIIWVGLTIDNADSASGSKMIEIGKPSASMQR